MKFEIVAEYFQKLEETSKRLEMFEILSELFKKTANEDIQGLVYIIEERVLPPFESLEIGMADRMLEKAIARATGTDIKRVSDLLKKRGDMGLVAEELASKVTTRLVKPKSLQLSQVYDTFLKTASISGSGAVEQKVAIISGILSQATPQEAKFIARFVSGQLRLGVGDPTIMDSLSKAKTAGREARPIIEHAYNLCSDLGFVAKTLFEKGENALKKFDVTPGKPVRMAAAERLPSAKEIVEKIGGECIVQQKYDGFRLQCHKIGEKVFLFSRNLENMTHMFPDIIESVKKYVKAKNAIFEGEALVYDEETGELQPFQVTITRKRKYDIEAKKKELPLKMFIFDLLYADGKDYTTEPYEKRLKAMKEIIKESETIEYAKQIVTDNPEKMNAFFEESVTNGLEGIMVKRPDAPYAAGSRNFNWIKLKRSYKSELNDTMDLVIIGYLRGMGSRTKFGIGAILGAVYDKKRDEFQSIAKVGSGFTEENWLKLRKELDKVATKQKPARVNTEMEPDVWVVPKYVVEVTADEITRSPMHTAGRSSKSESGFALRFPRAKSYIRVDKSPEEATTVHEIEQMFNAQKKVGLKEE